MAGQGMFYYNVSNVLGGGMGGGISVFTGGDKQQFYE
jgi:hypothetical protein